MNELFAWGAAVVVVVLVARFISHVMVRKVR